MLQQNLESERARQLLTQIEKYEDAGFGSCIFVMPKIQQILVSSLEYIAKNSATLFAYVIMPNHVHMLLQPEVTPLSQIITSFKHVTGHAINAELKKNAPVWEREYFDRFLRDAAHFSRCVKYICHNRDSMSGKAKLWLNDGIAAEDTAVPANVRYHQDVRSTAVNHWISPRRINHFDEIGICQFVTIRLCDAVPASVILTWKQELGFSSE